MNYNCHVTTNNLASVIGIKQMEIDTLKAQVIHLRGYLERLAKLGNGDRYGNSVGNDIAIEALKATPEQCLAEVKAEAIKDAAFTIISDRKGVFGVEDNEMYQDFCRYADMLLDVK